MNAGDSNRTINKSSNNPHHHLCVLNVTWASARVSQGIPTTPHGGREVSFYSGRIPGVAVSGRGFSRIR